MKKILIFLMMILPLSSIAKDINPFKQCGIGAMIFPKRATLALISNIIWDLGTTAMISSEFSPHLCEGKGIDTAHLILRTLPGLERDIAMGDGEYLKRLASITGCQEITGDAFSNEIRVHYSTYLNNESYYSSSAVDRASDIYEGVKKTIAQFDSCKDIL